MTDLGLREAIDGLYATFSRYPLRSAIDGCPHCVSPADQALLREAPLGDLRGAALVRFAAKAITTWGEADDLRHFLPRLLELAVTDDSDLYLVVGKLRYARWREWPDGEQKAIEDYFEALWRATLSGAVTAWTGARLLPVLGQVSEDLSPMLNIWRQDTTEVALCQLAELVRETAFTAPRGRERGIVAWLVHQDTRESLEAGFFLAGSPDVAQTLSDAVDALSWLPSTTT